MTTENERRNGIGGQDLELARLWLNWIDTGHIYAIARREASRQRHAYALYIYGATDTAWVRKDGAHDHELKHGAPALGW